MSLSPEQQAAMDRAEAAAEMQAEEARANTPKQRTRAAAQGLTFGFADEVEARFRSIGSRTYDEIVAEIRGVNADYSEAFPVESLAYEIGGAVAPALLAAPFTGGASVGAATGRVAPRVLSAGAKTLGLTGTRGLGGAVATSTAQGALTGLGKGEGNIVDRAGGGLVGAATGGALGVGGHLAAAGLGRAATGVVEFANRKLGGRGKAIVENELARLVKDSGMSADEIVEGIASGGIMAENKTLLDAVRSYRATGGLAATKLDDGMRPRPEATRSEAMGVLQDNLSSVDDPNILRGMKKSDDELQAIENKAYEPFETQPAPAEVVTALEDAIGRVPSSGKILDDIFKTKTGKAPFQLQEDGQVVFSRIPTVEEAEVVRRVINDRVSIEYRGGSGTLGKSLKDVEKDLRSALDTNVTPLRDVRETASVVRGAQEAFKDGTKALGKSPDQVAIDLAEIASKGGEARVKAYRAGVMSGIRQKMTLGSRKSMMRNLADENRKEGAILRIVMPEDDLPNAMKLIERAEASQDATGFVLGQSATSPTAGQAARQGSKVSAEDVMEVLSGPNVFNIKRLVGKVAKDIGPELSDADREKIVETLVSTDPNFVLNMLTNKGGLAALEEAVSRLSSGVTAGAQKGAATYGGDPKRLRGLLDGAQ